MLDWNTNLRLFLLGGEGHNKTPARTKNRGTPPHIRTIYIYVALKINV